MTIEPARLRAAMSAVMAELEARSCAADLDLPHVVLVVDPYLNDDTIDLRGPFPGPVEASAWVEAFVASVVEPEYPEPPVCLVIPIHAP